MSVRTRFFISLHSAKVLVRKYEVLQLLVVVVLLKYLFLGFAFSTSPNYHGAKHQGSRDPYKALALIMGEVLLYLCSAKVLVR